MVLAQDIAKLLDAKKQRYTPRPWNRFKPADTLWWVVPGTHWPAYSSGKYMFRPDGKLIWCGLNIEKGFGEKAALAYPQLKRRKLVAEGGWIWHQFIKDLEAREIGHAISEVEKNTKGQVYLSLGAGLVSDPSDFDPDSPKADSLVFTVTSGELQLISNKLSNRTLLPLMNATQLHNLFDSLPPDVLDWIWIDMDISVSFQVAQGEVQSLDAMDVYNLALRPFEPWVK